MVRLKVVRKCGRSGRRTNFIIVQFLSFRRPVSAQVVLVDLLSLSQNLISVNLVLSLRLFRRLAIDRGPASDRLLLYSLKFAWNRHIWAWDIRGLLFTLWFWTCLRLLSPGWRSSLELLSNFSDRLLSCFFKVLVVHLVEWDVGNTVRLTCGTLILIV